MTFNVNEDLKDFKNDSKKIINVEKGGYEISNGADNDESGVASNILKNLFVTQDENDALDEFEKEKDREIEDELGNKVKAPEVKKGWNEWAGAGANDDRLNKRIA